MPVSSSRWVPNLAAQRTGLTAMGIRNTSKVTLRVLNLSRVKCPVDTGNLRNSHQMRVSYEPARNHVTGHVFTHVKYARPVHEGRGSRIIRVKRARYLRFFWKGRWWYRKQVHQGPVRGQPWMRSALREVAATEGYKMTKSPRYNYPAGHL